MKIQVYMGQKIKALRKKRGLTQEQLAKKVGSVQSAIARLEAGKHSTNYEYLTRVVKALGVELYPPEFSKPN